MKPPFLSFLTALALVSPVLAEDAASTSTTGGFRRASLLERPPFARVETSTRAVGGPLELRGFFGAGDHLEVSLSRPSTKESLWVRVGDTTSKWIVDSADVEAGTAEVRFDGMNLHLTLAKPEVPPPGAATPPPAAVVAPAQAPAPQERTAMSREGREAMTKARREFFESARTQHPEYFDGTQLSEAQQQARSAYMASMNDKVREAVAAVSPADAERMGGANAQPGGNRTLNAPQGGNNAGAQQQGNNRGGQRPQRGGN